MARLARVVVAGLPHHITQRGNRRQKTFFRDSDYKLYLELMGHWCAERGVEIWSYCLMPNHVHLIAVPARESGLRRGIGEAHRRYTRAVNFREKWRGHLWQGRFGSFVMEESYLWAAARYVALNPVRAKLVRRAIDYPWSSTKALVKGEDDDLVRVGPLRRRVKDWKKFLSPAGDEAEAELIRRHERTGRPLGSEKFVKGLETRLFRTLRPGKPGPKRKGRGQS